MAADLNKPVPRETLDNLCAVIRDNFAALVTAMEFGDPANLPAGAKKLLDSGVDRWDGDTWQAFARFAALGGSATQRFKVANAVESDEAMALSQFREVTAVTGDWNNYIKGGWYEGFELANRPAGTGWVRMFVLPNATTDWAQQTAYDYLSDRIWTRRRAAGSWQPWVEMAKKSDIIVPSPMYASVLSGTIGSTISTILTLDMGSVFSGQQYFVTAHVAGFKVGAEGQTSCSVQKNTGTANMSFSGLHQISDSVRSVGFQELNTSGLMQITSSGTLVLRIRSQSLGSDFTISPGVFLNAFRVA